MVQEKVITEQRLTEIYQNIQNQRPTTKDYFVMTAMYGIWISCSRVWGAEDPRNNSLCRDLIYLDSSLSSLSPQLASIVITPFMSYLNFLLAVQEKAEGSLDKFRKQSVDKLMIHAKPYRGMSVLYQSGVEIGIEGLGLAERADLQLFQQAFGLQSLFRLIQPTYKKGLLGFLLSNEVITLMDKAAEEEIKNDVRTLANTEGIHRAVIATANRLGSFFTNPDFDVTRAQKMIKENSQYLAEVSRS